MDWASLWSRPDQQAARALHEGDAAKAAKLFQDPAWKGSAQYKSGDFKGAIESLKQADDLDSLYNMGNALARAGNYEEAVGVYDKVLKQDPDNEDARYNKELLEKELEKQQQYKQQQSGQNGKDKDKKQQKQQEQGQNNRKQAGKQNQEQNQQAKQDNDRQQAGQDKDQQQQDRQQQQRQQQQARQQQNKSDDAKQKQEQQQRMAKSDITTPDEDQQALEQWLRRIPDDPAGLLRRKFRYQYQQRDKDVQPSGKTW